MVVAWLGFAGIGIIMARYFKDTWMRGDCCGLAQWFLWHRFLMMSTWGLTVAAFICIVVDVGGFDYSLPYNNPHPFLGLLVLALVSIQPLVALFRPSADTSYRWVFNWAHWFIGNSTHVIAILTMFFAIGLPKAGLPTEVTWMLVFYVGWYLVTHVVLSLNICWADNLPSSRSQIYPLSGRGSAEIGILEENVYLEKDKPGSGCRIFCLALHLVIVVVIILLIVYAVIMAPDNMLLELGLIHQQV
ncbi:putative ferric-chelate reductase 1 homolog [Eurytemora carolleeae]|uniref:putative ferric-chelate reductase 1 homolog n=1 Tax=Eurytemora carolleeae TaxID=1294199 RepID=UPI000C76C78B|nr:putative ferric-chelate reductase 1 homolog [Eurytemora carolleeae]|eukprot:XP_023332869.1 putative ferric-chelate reductase 1 homolog [Eurytemora affinis]